MGRSGGGDSAGGISGGGGGGELSILYQVAPAGCKKYPGNKSLPGNGYKSL